MAMKLQRAERLRSKYVLHPIIGQLREFAAKRPPSRPDFVAWFGYMTNGYVVVSARLDSLAEWYYATDDERRMFLLLVAYDIETYWEVPQ